MKSGLKNLRISYSKVLTACLLLRFLSDLICSELWLKRKCYVMHSVINRRQIRFRNLNFNFNSVSRLRQAPVLLPFIHCVGLDLNYSKVRKSQHKNSEKYYVLFGFLDWNFEVAVRTTRLSIVWIDCRGSSVVIRRSLHCILKVLHIPWEVVSVGISSRSFVA